MSDNPFKAPAETPMTFRDACAVAAMQAMLSVVFKNLTDASGDDDVSGAVIVDQLRGTAAAAYDVADAMLEARDARRVGR